LLTTVCTAEQALETSVVATETERREAFEAHGWRLLPPRPRSDWCPCPTIGIGRG
jgi:hypothetical protein